MHCRTSSGSRIFLLQTDFMQLLFGRGFSTMSLLFCPFLSRTFFRLCIVSFI